MARLPNQRFSIQALDERIEFTSAVSVTADGMFSFTIPDFLEHNASAECTSSATPVHLSGGRANTRVSGRDMQACIAVIKHALKAYAAPRVTEELVILYNIEAHASYFRTEDGTLEPNGVVYGKDGKWSGPGNHSASNPCQGGYSLTIGARVLNKKTTSRGEVTEVDYEWVSFDENDDAHQWAYQLNRFCAFTLDQESRGTIRESVKEMPYSEEGAKFFHSMMMGICGLIDKVHTAFDIPAHELQRRISEHVVPVLLQDNSSPIPAVPRAPRPRRKVDQ